MASYFYRGCIVDASFNSNGGIDPSSLPLSNEGDPQQWLNELAHFTKTLSCPLTPALNESMVSTAVSTVEKSVNKLHRWVQEDFNSDLKRKVASGVSAALKSICALKPAIGKVSQGDLSTITRVLDVGDRLLQCHQLIKDQMVQSSV